MLSYKTIEPHTLGVKDTEKVFATLEVKLDVESDTVWLNRHQISDLFGRDVKTIDKHIKNALQEELFCDAGLNKENAVVAKFATTAADGKTYQVEYYNLDVIISVGYRVKWFYP